MAMDVVVKKRYHDNVKIELRRLTGWLLTAKLRTSRRASYEREHAGCAKIDTVITGHNIVNF